MNAQELFKKYATDDWGNGFTLMEEENFIKAIAEIISHPLEAEVKPACERCKWIETQLKKVIAYPTEAQGRRTSDGYPEEFVYDEFSYKRMIDSVRDALKNILKESKSV